MEGVALRRQRREAASAPYRSAEISRPAAGSTGRGRKRLRDARHTPVVRAPLASIEHARDRRASVSTTAMFDSSIRARIGQRSGKDQRFFARFAVFSGRSGTRFPKRSAAFGGSVGNRTLEVLGSIPSTSNENRAPRRKPRGPMCFRALVSVRRARRDARREDGGRPQGRYRRSTGREDTTSTPGTFASMAHTKLER